MPAFSVGGVRLNYLDVGAGPVVVLIHGLGSSGADWAFQTASLRHQCRVIAPDLRGSGSSDAPPGPYSIAGFADDVWALLDALGIAQIGLVGFSMGGAVATEVALKRPHAVTHLLTINSLPDYRVNTLAKVLEVYGQALLVRALGLKRIAPGIAKRLFPFDHQAPMRARVVSVLSDLPQRPYLDTVRALAGWTALDRLKTTPVPLTMLAAEFDYTPLAEKLAFADALGATLKVVEGSRHGTPFDSITATRRMMEHCFFGQPLGLDERLAIDTIEQTPTGPPD
jgi:3-oxoadipate enol-lactonase